MRINALNTMIPDIIDNDNADSVVADDHLIDEKNNSRYQFISMHFSLAKVQDQSTLSYVGALKTILETLKVVLDKQIDAKHIEDKQIEDKQIDMPNTN